MDLQNGDFVWVYINETDKIEWAFVFNDKLIYQSGGFDELSAFNEEYKIVDGFTQLAYLGHAVRNATSFCSAKFYYDWFIENDYGRYIDHNTQMKVITHGDDFISEADMIIYKSINDENLTLTLSDLRTMFNRNVVIVADNK